MRLLRNVSTRLKSIGALVGLGLTLSACSGGASIAPLEAASAATGSEPSGPAADYPVVLGNPFVVDGQEYTPTDTMNYDQVGYASIDQVPAAGVTVAHKTLPLPSYVELTSLATGKTILARVERRGPMTPSRLVALSPQASAQLGADEGGAIRVRRVNPPEDERAMLRAGAAAPDRIETPPSLLAILKRKLPENGSASLAATAPAKRPPELPAMANATQQTRPVAVPPSHMNQTPPFAATPNTFQQAFSEERRAVTSYPLAPLSGVQTASAPRVVRNVVPRQASIAQNETPRSEVSEDGRFVVQAAAFSQQANADKAANAVGGFVEQSGRFYRVRIGPFANRGQAEAALAKARAAGYSDARVYTTG